ncbi:hypothetical protein EKO04_001107 [Ascochyta lentis]|uniref:Transcription factor TFIIIC triple barrel domain-containing protein n=1 Tax=Ascochyta lentis TaxID=205686 RepID=A0A8H7JF01_9PLEO|nr:hypothetical protein EKO04_001107 [Ascochyta lentis]
MTDAAPDEWEYEYSSTETETFYIPIDLSNVPTGHALIDSERRTGHPTLLKSRLRALNAQRGQQQEVPVVGGSSERDPAILGEAQVAGLHTPNPLVVYNGQLLSCQWAATVGSDLFFVKPGGGGEEPLRSLPGVEVLAVGSAKLVARVGRLRPRDELFDGVGDGEGGAVAPALAEVNVADARDAAGVEEPEPASFLAKLNQAKAKRGDSTRLAVVQSGDGSRLVAEAVSGVTQDAGQGVGDVEMGGT